MFALKCLVTVLLADFVSGLVHWLEDAYARPGMPVVGRIAEDNLLHHRRPRAFLARSWWESSSDLVLIGLLAVWGALLTGHLSGWLLFFVALTINANQVHKWAHQGPRENPRLVTWLQRLRILQTQREHGRHHRGRKDSHYCVITNLLNRPLEALGFWKRLEALVERLTGVARRNDADYLPAAGH